MKCVATINVLQASLNQANKPLAEMATDSPKYLCLACPRRVAQLSADRIIDEDKTLIEGDFKTITECLESIGCVPFADTSKVVTELGEGQVANISSFLRNSSKTNLVRVLCVIGHALGGGFDSHRLELGEEEKTSFQWKWPPVSCTGEAGSGLAEGHLGSEVFQNAGKGDVVVFGRGFLSMGWILEQLKLREDEVEEEAGLEMSTLIFLVDACYSGTWTDKLKTDFQKSGLKKTRLIVQTSCLANEVSYPQLFIPLWRDLQRSNHASGSSESVGVRSVTLVSARTGGESTDRDFNAKLQTPTFFDSAPNSPIPCGYKFFTDNCQFEIEKPSLFTRGKSAYEYLEYSNDLLTAIASNDQITFTNFKLKTYNHRGKPTPLLFIFVEWKGKPSHLHLHYNSFDVRKQKLTSITHEDVCHTEYREMPKTKCHMDSEHEFWPGYKICKFVTTKCKSYVTAKGEDWDNEYSWNMIRYKNRTSLQRWTPVKSDSMLDAACNQEHDDRRTITPTYQEHNHRRTFTPTYQERDDRGSDANALVLFIIFLFFIFGALYIVYYNKPYWK